MADVEVPIRTKVAVPLIPPEGSLASRTIFKVPYRQKQASSGFFIPFLMVCSDLKNDNKKPDRLVFQWRELNEFLCIFRVFSGRMGVVSIISALMEKRRLWARQR